MFARLSLVSLLALSFFAVAAPPPVTVTVTQICTVTSSGAPTVTRTTSVAPTSTAGNTATSVVSGVVTVTVTHTSIVGGPLPTTAGGSGNSHGHPTTTVTTVPVPTTAIPASQCNVKNLQCCNSVQSSSSGGVPGLLGLLGIIIKGVAIPVGLTCTPINVLGIGGNSCTAQPVCCQNNSFNGLVALGCVPINLSL